MDAPPLEGQDLRLADWAIGGKDLQVARSKFQ